jgi:hypothetical protein
MWWAVVDSWRHLLRDDACILSLKTVASTPLSIVQSSLLLLLLLQPTLVRDNVMARRWMVPVIATVHALILATAAPTTLTIAHLVCLLQYLLLRPPLALTGHVLSDSCAGGQSLTSGTTCFCDFACIEFGDCCNVAAYTCPADSGTCDGACGGLSLTYGAICHCDEECTMYDDCCFDATSYCPSEVKAFRGEGSKAGGHSVTAGAARSTSGRKNVQKKY